jgi:hypothetical protein
LRVAQEFDGCEKSIHVEMGDASNGRRHAAILRRRQ